AQILNYENISVVQQFLVGGASKYPRIGRDAIWRSPKKNRVRSTRRRREDDGLQSNPISHRNHHLLERELRCLRQNDRKERRGNDQQTKNENQPRFSHGGSLFMSRHSAQETNEAQSERRATSGSIRDARSDGSRHASAATSVNSTTTPP